MARPPSTSAGIGLHRDHALAAFVARQRLVGEVCRALTTGGALVLLVGLAAIGREVAFADEHARCEAERDESGVGRPAALRAMEVPGWPSRFLYRVSSDDAGYRVRVVVKEGPFLGDAWERDHSGRMWHASDVCRDRAEASWVGLDVVASVVDET